MRGATSHSLDAERAVVGALLRNARRVLELVDVDARAFYLPAHQVVVQAVLDLVAAGKPVDELMVADQAGDKLTSLGGLSGLVEIGDGFLTAENVGHYLEIIRDHALKRRVCVAASEVLQVCDNEHDRGEDAHAEMLRQANGLSCLGADDAGSSAGVVAAAALRRIEDIADGRAKSDAVPTGFADIDARTGGFPRGVVTMLAARPSHGKTSMARSIGQNAARAGHGGHVFSMEDTGGRYGERMLADLAGVDLMKFKPNPTTGRVDLTRDERARLYVASRQIAEMPIRIDDRAGLSSTQIANAVRRAKRELNTALVVVDYVQLIHERGARDKREEVDRAGEAMVKLARTENVALVLLSQLSRENEKREDKKPMLSDLRESGTLEQLADIVIMLHQPARYLDESSKNAEVRAAYEKLRGRGTAFIRKNKHGSCGEVQLAWNEPTATYRDLSWKDTYR